VHTLLIAFEDRLSEVDAYLAFLQSLDEQTKNRRPRLKGALEAITVDQQRILYSSVYLHLYNLVESTMTRCVEAVAYAAHGGGRWAPADLSLKLRNEWVRHKARTHIDLTPQNRLASALSLFDDLVPNKPLSKFEFDRGGGGNWDDVAIETMSARLGCELKIDKASLSAIKRPWRNELKPLALVKDLRNNLAHGKISFIECAQDSTVADLTDLRDRTVNYLREVIRCFIDYLTRLEFLLPQSRPVEARNEPR
jgi:hypothetical protein